MNTNPPAVAIGPANAPERPVFCLPGGKPSVMPSGTCHAISPVLAFTAKRRSHGGLTQGRFPIDLPAASLAGAANPKKPGDLSYLRCVSLPKSGSGRIQSVPGASCELTKI